MSMVRAERAITAPVVSSGSISPKSCSKPAGLMGSRKRTGSSPGFQKARAMPRGLTRLSRW
jgi:hypothetical protein